MAWTAVKGEKTLAGLAQQFDVHPNQVTSWKGRFLEGAVEVFGSEPKGDAAPVVDVKTRHARTGKLTVANDFLSGTPGQGRLFERKAMIDGDQGLASTCSNEGSCSQLDHRKRPRTAR